MRNPDTSSLRMTLRAWRSVSMLAVRAWPAGAFGRPAVTVVSDVCRGVVPAVALQQVIEATTGGRGGRAGWMAVLVLGALAPSGLDGLWNHLQRGLDLRVTQAVSQTAMGACLAPAGVDHLESVRFADHMETVRAQRHVPALLFDWIVGAASGGLSVLISLVVLAGVDLRLLVPFAVAATAGTLQARSRAQTLVYLEQSLPGQRLATRLAGMATASSTAKEIRIQGLSPWLVERHGELAAEVAKTIARTERGPVLASAFSGGVQGLMLAAGIALLVRLASTGDVSVGELALGIVLLQATLSDAGWLGVIGADLAKNTHAARRFLWLLDYVPEVEAPIDPEPVPARLQTGIALGHASFTYPGTTRPALDDITLSLPAGATVALVGDNGSGKSTLVKLLCRFYDPSSGSVTVDGVDLRRLDLDAWRRATTGAFQDFLRMQVLARESVGVGNLTTMDDDARIRAATIAGGAAPFLDRLPKGYETQLGRQFTGGADLSEGQWQKVALSRGLMRGEPLLVVLDEPTAALDARAEHELFERFAFEAAAARVSGAVTLLVSHRFSTVSMADRIVVLDGGRVLEEGTHDELQAANGRYAELYALQAGAYR